MPYVRSAIWHILSKGVIESDAQMKAAPAGLAVGRAFRDRPCNPAGGSIKPPFRSTEEVRLSVGD